MKTMTIDEFITALKNQGVPQNHVALKCPICGAVQSADDLINAGAGDTFDAVEKYLGFSCVGRFTDAAGCDWTLGGLFQCHKLEVVTEDGKRHPRFEPVSADEALAHMQAKSAVQEADHAA